MRPVQDQDKDPNQTDSRPEARQDQRLVVLENLADDGVGGQKDKSPSCMGQCGGDPNLRNGRKENPAQRAPQQRRRFDSNHVK